MRYWLGLGSNLGDRGAALQGALDRLASRGVAVREVSPVYATAPQELREQPEFLNAAAMVDAELAPLAMLDAAKSVEAELGRGQGPRFGPRPVDCDLLLFEGGSFQHARLVIPHPRLAERRFALVPLLDLSSELTLPDGRLLSDLEAALDRLEQPVEHSDVTLAAPRVE